MLIYAGCRRQPSPTPAVRLKPRKEVIVVIKCRFCGYEAPDSYPFGCPNDCDIQVVEDELPGQEWLKAEREKNIKLGLITPVNKNK